MQYKVFYNKKDNQGYGGKVFEAKAGMKKLGLQKAAQKVLKDGDQIVRVEKV